MEFGAMDGMTLLKQLFFINATYWWYYTTYSFGNGALLNLS